MRRLRGDAAQVANPVAVAVEEASRLDLVDYRFVPPIIMILHSKPVCAFPAIRWHSGLPVRKFGVILVQRVPSDAGIRVSRLQNLDRGAHPRADAVSATNQPRCHRPQRNGTPSSRQRASVPVLPSGDLASRQVSRGPYGQFQYLAQGAQISVPWFNPISFPEVDAGLAHARTLSNFGNCQATLQPSVTKVARKIGFARQC